VAAVTGVLIACAAWRIVAIVLLLISTDIVLAVFVEITLFLIVGHASLLIGVASLWPSEGALALFPAIAGLAAAAAGARASGGAIAAFLSHCAGISAATFLSHFDLQFSLDAVSLPRDGTGQ
jgi:hypothetical protein